MLWRIVWLSSQVRHGSFDVIGGLPPITVTSWWAWWRLKSPASRLFTQSFMQAQIKENKTSKLRVTGLCAGNSPMTGEFPAQMATNAENVSIWWRHHATTSVVWFLSSGFILGEGCMVRAYLEYPNAMPQSHSSCSKIAHQRDTTSTKHQDKDIMPHQR